MFTMSGNLNAFLLTSIRSWHALSQKTAFTEASDTGKSMTLFCEGKNVKQHQQIDWSTIISRALLFSLIWWILSDGNAQSWWVGVPAILLTVIVSVALLPPAPILWRELLMFVPFFLRYSIKGGVDVAWRAFHPRIPIAPQLIDYPFRLPPGLSRVVLANTVSLLPGTLSVNVGEKVLQVHVLDGMGDIVPELEALEIRIARLSGVSLMTFQKGELNATI